MKHLINITIFLLIANAAVSQQADDNYLYWSATRKLTVHDFGMKINSQPNSSSFAQFVLDFEVKGFDIFTRNFNKKVHNYLIKSASWIDTTADVALALRYQQTLFDMAEIYARQFRKELKANRKKLFSGDKFTQQLNAAMMTAFANRRLAYDSETNMGTDAAKQLEWEAQIQTELQTLKDFSSE